MSLYVVTGAGRGIGHEVCRQLRQRGETVVAACRRAVPELASLGCEVVDGVDVTDDASVARLVTALAGRRVDVLVNNAGILARESLDELDFEGMRRQFEVNALAPLRVTRALLPNLGEGSKVAIITSRMGSIADNGSGGYYGYRMSKAAVNMAGVSLARDLGERGIAVLLLHGHGGDGDDRRERHPGAAVRREPDRAHRLARPRAERELPSRRRAAAALVTQATATPTPEAQPSMEALRTRLCRPSLSVEQGDHVAEAAGTCRVGRGDALPVAQLPVRTGGEQRGD